MNDCSKYLFYRTELKYLILQSLPFKEINELKRPRAEFINETLPHLKMFSVSCYLKRPKYLVTIFGTLSTNIYHCPP